nr:MAG TPA: hypothetical protein [Caudoviricetes sp.]
MTGRVQSCDVKPGPKAARTGQRHCCLAAFTTSTGSGATGSPR